MKKITLSPTIKDILYPLGITSIISCDVDLLDIGKDENTVSFIPVNRIDRAKQQGLNPWKDMRTEMKLGKFLNKHYSYNQEIIENIVLRYRMFYNFALNNGENIFESVQGNDIAYWYDQRNYKHGGGSLNGSCMRYEEPDRFNLYTGNPDKIKLLILKESGKLIGRALLWTSDEGKQYLDRPYTRYDEDIRLYRMYAEKKNMHHYYARSKITEFNVTVKDGTATGRLPYLDSMNVQGNRVMLKSHHLAQPVATFQG